VSDSDSGRIFNENCTLVGIEVRSRNNNNRRCINNPATGNGRMQNGNLFGQRRFWGSHSISTPKIFLAVQHINTSILMPWFGNMVLI
jgi:hypothetical protein